jgi:capsular polysaccharide export protein
MLNHAHTAILSYGLSKYNYAPGLDHKLLVSNNLWSESQVDINHISKNSCLIGDPSKILVVDQTFGDMSVKYGSASSQTFTAMLSAALTENPQATIYVKTHPEVSYGKKSGYLT